MATKTSPTIVPTGDRLTYETSEDFKECARCGGMQITPAHTCDVAVRVCPDGHFVRASLSKGEERCPSCGKELHIESCGGAMIPVVQHHEE